MDSVYKYYTLYRAPGPFCQPKDGLLEVKSYDKRTRITERYAAWGEVTYSRKLTEEEIRDFELLPAK
jgi:hypothetical protein